jgi:hypothetical protein
MSITIRIVPLEVLLDALRRAVEARSYRAVAKEAKLAPRALKMLVEGETTAPRSKTLGLLRAWFARELAGANHAAVAVVQELLADLPVSAHGAGASAIATTVIDLYRRSGVEPPAWAVALTNGPNPVGPGAGDSDAAPGPGRARTRSPRPPTRSRRDRRHPSTRHLSRSGGHRTGVEHGHRMKRVWIVVRLLGGIFRPAL